MSLGVVPFTLQLPAGYGFPDTTSATQGGAAASSQAGAGGSASGSSDSGSSASGPSDVVSISNSWNSGTITTQAGDTYRLGDLFKGSASGASIAGYRVALGGAGGQLLLNGVDVSNRSSFTADEFARLSFVAGVADSQQSLTVVAQAGKRQGDGSISRQVDSQAVQITAAVTGTRSINAMNALVLSGTGTTDANIVAAVKEAAILTGVGASSRPSLSTDGNFTTQAGDTYRLGDLFKGSAASGASIAGYRVALGGAGGQLLLNGVDVSDRSSFTADEFARLSFVAGVADSQQSLTVVAQAGKRQGDGSISRQVDSQAVQITAAVTGTRSINAMNALVSPDPEAADANIVAAVKEAAILTGVGASSRPTVQTAVTPVPGASGTAQAVSTGGYMSSDTTSTNAVADLASYDPAAIGSLVAAGIFANPANSLTLALLLLGGDGTGAFRSAGTMTGQAVAARAYAITKSL